MDLLMFSIYLLVYLFNMLMFRNSNIDIYIVQIICSVQV